MPRPLFHFCLVIAVSVATACAPSGPAQSDHASDGTIESTSQELPHSAARPSEVRLRHLTLDLDVDFESKRLSGTARLDLDRRDHASTLWLDTDDLAIAAVRSLPSGETLDFELRPDDPIFGSALSIVLNEETRAIEIDYSTSPGAGALQWLSAEQTGGGRHPFLFTQSQSILARSWVPCQDTPAVRFTYEATIRVPPGLMAVMSAENPTERSADGSYAFAMPQAIPSYLLAMAVGDIDFAELGPRTGVYAEPEMIELAAWEFANTEAMMDVAAATYGPYDWGRYDILVLPPSFPFGGMENPRLTFVTPTIITGDRSLTTLIAHELAHSWSGNLVTNATWNDFWLNEGFTSYFELRIMEDLQGRETSEMLASLAYDNLIEEIEGLDDRDTWLSLDLSGRNPDDGATGIPYDKGYLFLRLIEETAGREAFDEFSNQWFDGHRFESVRVEQFLDELRSALPETAAAIDIEAWVYGPGLPPNLPIPKAGVFEPVDELVAEFITTGKIAADEATTWKTQHWLHFLGGLPKDMGSDRMAELDRIFGFTESSNSEIIAAWLELAIQQGYDATDDRLEDFLTSVGRTRYLAPIYTALAVTPEGLEAAKAIYDRARSGYHPVTQHAIDSIVRSEESS